MLEIKSVTCGYKKKKQTRNVVNNLSFSFMEGEILCMLGANGIGKTTLFKSILGGLPLLKGDILVNGQSIIGLSKQERARYIAYVPQSHTPPFPYNVLDVVLMGRAAHLSAVSSPGAKDVMIAEDALERLGIIHLKNRIYTELSGGERQLVLIARALAQETQILLMDEPTSNLDYGNQIRVLQEIRKLAKDGRGVMFTSHYPDHAFLCASKVVVLKNADEHMEGYCNEIITEETMRDIYRIDTKIMKAEMKSGEEMNFCIPYL